MTNDCYKVDLAKEFAVGVKNRIADQEKNIDLRRVSKDFNRISNIVKYSYNFEWSGRPIIQYPQDICAMQELIYQTRPDLIVETGIAHGGSLVFYASMLLLLDYEDAVQRGQQLDPQKPGRMVLGVDVDIRKHNRVTREGAATGTPNILITKNGHQSLSIHPDFMNQGTTTQGACL